MAKDIYKVEIGTPSAWKLDGAILNFGDNNKNLFAIGMDFTYTRANQNLFPINRDYRLILAGIPSGAGKITTIVGPYGSIKTFLNQFGDVCNVKENTLLLTPSGAEPCEAEGGEAVENAAFKLWGVLVNSFGVNVANQNGLGLVNSTIAITFTGLEVLEKTT